MFWETFFTILAAVSFPPLTLASAILPVFSIRYLIGKQSSKAWAVFIAWIPVFLLLIASLAYLTVSEMSGANG